uniref:Putative lipocal-1 1 n=2 Tax=Ixodes ricinus TaxID=34613 RepID=V5H5M2_IXORI
MYHWFLGVALLSILQASDVSSSLPYMNPDLQKYQDPGKCLPLQEKWYTLYRNYESDPAFGGTDPCIEFTCLGPAVDGAFPFTIRYGDTSANMTLTLSASEGYTTQNLLHFQQIGQKESMLVTASYSDCMTCVVFRSTYINEGACSLIVPESALGKELSCCDYLFDLLCDATPKFNIYNESCFK